MKKLEEMANEGILDGSLFEREDVEIHDYEISIQLDEEYIKKRQRRK